jgi:hypothetical protein
LLEPRSLIARHYFKEDFFMACFLVPAAEAIIVSAAVKISEKNEKAKYSLPKGAVKHTEIEEDSHKLPFSKKLSWLRNLLWGGTILLAFEHLWHGEISPFFPFLTAASNPQDTAVMLHELATVGVSMTVAVTAIWGVMLLAAKIKESKIEKAERIKE